MRMPCRFTASPYRLRGIDPQRHAYGHHAGEHADRHHGGKARHGVERHQQHVLREQRRGEGGRDLADPSKVYRQLPDGWKLHSLYRRLTGVGNRLLKNDHYTDESLTDALWQYLFSIGFRNDIEYDTVPESTATYQETSVQETIDPKHRKKQKHIIVCRKQRQQQFRLSNYPRIITDSHSLLQRIRAPACKYATRSIRIVSTLFFRQSFLLSL